MTKKTVSKTIIGAIIGAIAVIIGAILTPVVQHWLERSEIKRPDSNLVSEYFPLFVGSTHTYAVGRSTPQVGGGNDLQEEIGSYTEQVMMVESSSSDVIHVYQIEQSSGAFDLDCTGFLPTTNKTKKWYITNNTTIYVACNEEEKGKIIHGLYDQLSLRTTTPNSDLLLPKFVFPLRVNNKWAVFSDTQPREDNIYVCMVCGI